jgi:Na+/H+-dicarboxylate symporter/ABC-type amino acid transport substrate-binding protein
VALQIQEHKKLLVNILISIGLGIFSGLFFGEYCIVLKPVGDIYVMLLQSVVYPYLITSLVGSLGKMDRHQTVQLLKKSWIIYLLLILGTFFIILVLIQAIPNAKSHIVPLGGGSDPWTQLQESLQLFIPANPFQALVDNAVPAVIFLSVLYGIALQEFKNKESHIAFCEWISRSSLQIWNWIIKVAPWGIFALMAYTFGTVSFSSIKDLILYAILFFTGALFLTFVFLPLLLRVFTLNSYRELLSGLQNAFIISLATTISVASLPFIAEAARLFSKKQKIDSPEANQVIDNSISISYPICQIGNCFGLLFVVAASVYFHQALSCSQITMLSFASFFSSVGSPSASINSISLLLNLAHLPNDGLQLYALLLPFTRYPQVLVSVMGIAFFVFATTSSYFKKIKFQFKPLALLTILTIPFVFINIRFISSLPILSSATTQNLLYFQIPDTLKKDVSVRFSTSGFLNPKPFSLAEIQQRGTLRVGFNPNMMPWCYYNKKNELVGYDVAFMYQLAKDIHVNLEFIPFAWNDLVKNMQDNLFDIAIGSIYLTSERLEHVGFTRSYYNSVSSFIVRNEFASYFNNLSNIKKIQNLRIGVFNDPITLPIAKLNFSPQEIVVMQDYNHAFEDPQIDAVLWSKGHTDAWVSVYDGLTSISAEGIVQGWPQMMSFMVNKESSDLLNFLNDWLDLKEVEGFTQNERNKWILRSTPKETVSKKSLLHTILDHKH